MLPFQFSTGNALDTIKAFIIYFSDCCSPGGHICVEDIHASVALLFLRAVQINTILCSKPLVEF